MTTNTLVRHACARCGKRQPADRMVYSKHSHLRYCRDFKTCDRRATRAQDKQTRGDAMLAATVGLIPSPPLPDNHETGRSS